MTLVPFSTLTPRQRFDYHVAEIRAGVWLAFRWIGDKLAESARLWLVGVRAIGEWLGLIEPTPPAPVLRPVPTLHPRYSIRASRTSSTGSDLLDHFDRVGYPFASVDSAFSVADAARRTGETPASLGYGGTRETYLLHFPETKDAA